MPNLNRLTSWSSHRSGRGRAESSESIPSRSQRSRQSQSRSRSRPSRPSSLRHVRSAGHIDGQVFHNEYDHHEEIHNSDGETEDDKERGTKEKQPNNADVSGAITKEAETSSVGEREEEEEEEGPVDGDHSDAATEKDLEKGETHSAPIRVPSAKAPSTKAKDPNVVSWDGPDDPENPKNWSVRKRWGATFIVSTFTFISPVSSSMVAPALPTMAADLNVTNSVEIQLMLSIFVLAYAIGPLFLGPLSELYGRVIILQVANAFFLVFNLAAGFSQTGAQMLVFRFLSGIGGSAPLAIGGGVLADCWPPDQRGKAISVYSLAPLVGPAVGPIAGGFITAGTTWRWAFWAVSIVDAAIQGLGLIYLRETYAPVLLHRRTVARRRETGNDKLVSEYDDMVNMPILKKLGISFFRPFRMLVTQPIIMVLALYLALLYGELYLLLSTVSTLYTDQYHQSVGISGLHYIAIGLGAWGGAQISAPLNDRIYRYLRRTRGNGVGIPEYRVPLIVPAAVLVPVGAFWYGWSAQANIFWIMPDIGLTIFSAGVIVSFQSIQTYIVDAYTRYAASGIAATTVLRSLAGFGFPLFAPAMYNSLGYGWGNSVLGFAAIVLGFPGPLLLWKYGAQLRKKSPFAAGGF